MCHVRKRVVKSSLDSLRVRGRSAECFPFIIIFVYRVGVPSLFVITYRHRVWFATEYLNLIDCNYTVRCCMAYEYVFEYACDVFQLLLCVFLYYCCCICCCLLLLFGLLLWLIASDPSVFFVFIIQTRLLMYPLAVLSLLQPRFIYNTSSVIAGTRGTKAGFARRGEARLVYIIYMYLYLGDIDQIYR